MVGWHHQLSGHGLEQALGDGEGQGSLACCHSWGPRELDMTERLNNKSSPPGEDVGAVYLVLASQEAGVGGVGRGDKEGWKSSSLNNE